MRTSMFIAIALAAVALAGCSDEIPSGDLASTGSSIVVMGNVTAEYQAFNNPYAQTGGTELECEADQAPDPVPADDCQFPYTKVNGHIMELPDIGANSYKAFFVDSSGTNPNLEISVTDTGAGMYDLEYDNEASCDGQTSDAGCKLDGMYDTIEVHAMLASTTVPVATVGINGGALAVHAATQGVSFTATWSGKEMTVTVSGLDEAAPLPITGWFVNVDDVGTKTHTVEVQLSGNGEHVVRAPENIDRYQEFHIHVAGTAINVAVGTIA